jgi:type II secretory pathway pseudopilin PulG
MNRRRKPRHGLTLIEVLLLIGIFVCLIFMLFPAVQAAREPARRAACANNMKRLGLAIHSYASAFRQHLPASSGVSRDSDGKITAVDGWSWLVLVLPYLTDKEDAGVSTACKDLYDKLDITHGRPLTEPEGAKGTPHAEVSATSFPGLLCPSFGGNPYTDFGGKKAAITSYHPLGATHIESLSAASPNPLTPKYKPDALSAEIAARQGPLHPDGNCIPGTTFSLKAFRNGTSDTVLAVESIEPRHARWTVGADAALVAFPPCVEFERHKSGYLPKGYQDALAQRSEADSTYWAYQSYLDWDYGQSPYDAADGDSGKRYGPSSSHPSVVGHLFMDASGRMIGRDIDIAIYMLLVRARFPYW